MKKILKIFSVLFLFSVIVQNCSAFQDCRFIQNTMIIETLKKHIENYDIADMYKPEEHVNISYKETVFVVSTKDENIQEIVTVVPVLNSKFNKVLGEIVTPIKISNTYTIYDILDVLTSKVHGNGLNFKLHTPMPKSTKLGFNAFIYMPANRLYDALKTANIVVRDYDRVFYVSSPDGSSTNFDNLQIVHETPEGNFQKFVFQKSSGIKLIKSRSLIQRLIDCLFDFSSKENRGYVKLSNSPPRSLFEFDKAKSE